MGAGPGAGDSKLQGRSIYTELYVPPKATNVGVQLLAESAGVAAAIEGAALARADVAVPAAKGGGGARRPEEARNRQRRLLRLRQRRRPLRQPFLWPPSAASATPCCPARRAAGRPG